MKKKLVVLICVLALLCSFSARANNPPDSTVSPVYAQNEEIENGVIKVIANGKRVSYDTQVYVNIDGIMMVPVRHTMEAMGGKVMWQSETNTVFISHDDTFCAIQLGQDIIFKGDERIQMPHEAIANDCRTLVPIYFFEAAFGFNLDYDLNTIVITK